MARTIEIDGDDHTDLVRLESLAIVESAFGGEVGIGGFNRDDLALENVPAMKLVTITEDDATPDLMFKGYTSVRGLDRGPLSRQANHRQWDVTILDLNTVVDDEVFQTSSANRPEETDYARITWLLTTGAFSALGISAGVVPNTNTVTMDAVDYRHQGPRAVLDECAEAAKKNYFLYDYDDTGPYLYYDLATGTSLTSDLTLSTVLADVDYTTCFPFDAPTPHLSLDPIRVYSAVDFGYASGYVFVQDTDIATEFRRREIAISDTDVKTAAKATAKAEAYLEAVSTEQKTFTGTVSVPSTLVNAIRAGMRIQVKVPHLGFPDFTWMRISRREVTMEQGQGGVSDTNYTIALEFAEDLRPTRYGGTGGTPGEDGGLESGLDLIRYQLFDELGSQYFYDSFFGTQRVDPDFDFDVLGGLDASDVSREVEGNISYPYTDCGISSGALAGVATSEAWYQFEVDLADTAITGVRFTVAPCTNFDGNADASSVLVAGVALATPTDRDQFTTLDSFAAGDGATVFIPRSELQDDGDGPCYFVLAPGWDIPDGFSRCVDTESDLISGAVEVDPNDTSPLVTAVVVSTPP